MDSKIRVFHGLVNYGTQAGLFAQEMRNRGIEALSVSMPDKYKRLVDVELLHGKNILLKTFGHSWNWIRRIYWFFRFNTFHFYYGTSLLPYHLDLPLYRFFNKKVFHHYLGKDVKLYGESVARYSISNMYYSSGSSEEASKSDRKKLKRLKFETKFSDVQIVCSPVYEEFVPNSILIPLAIDLSKYKYDPKAFVPDRLKIMHAPTSRDNKGTQFVINAIDKLVDEGYDIEFILAENVMHERLLIMYRECDIFIDQVLGGYGTAAIEAMAIGRPTISYLRDVHFNNDKFPGGIPITVAHKDTLYFVLKEMISRKEELLTIGQECREFVERYHDVRVLTDKILKLYRKVHNSGL